MYPFFGDVGYISSIMLPNRNFSLIFISYLTKIELPLANVKSGIIIMIIIWMEFH